MVSQKEPVGASLNDDSTRTWIADRLLHGDCAQRVIDDLCSHRGVELDSARREVMTALNDPCLKTALGRVKRSNKLRTYCELRSALWERSERSMRISEAAGMDAATFEDDYYFENEPVIIRGAAAHWDAVSKWSPSYFANRYPEIEVEYASGTTRYRRKNPPAERISLGEFARMVESTVASNEFYITATNRTFRDASGLEALKGDVGSLPFLSDLDISGADGLNLWFGPRGTVTPLHHDVMNVVFVQIYGTKEFVLAPPFYQPRLHNSYGVYSDVDPVVPARFADAARVKWLTFTVRPADVLFIPAGWWHWVFAASTSISVSFSNFSVGGVRDVLPSFRGTLEVDP